MDVSVIYVNYHTSNLIADSLESLYAHTKGLKFEVIIVDNASEPDLEQMISTRFPGKGIKFVMLDENLGFGLANNAGFAIADGRNLFCLNPDTVLINNAVGILSEYLDKHADTGCVGGNLYDEQMNPTYSFRRMLPGLRWDISELLHLMPERIAYGRSQRFNYEADPIDVGFISGADIMIKRSVLEQTGGFSDRFFMYYEETDLCKRIIRAGYKIKNIPAAKIQHLEGGSFSDTGINFKRLDRSERGRYEYYMRNVGKFRRGVCNAIYRMFLFSRKVLKHDKAYGYRLSIQKDIWGK